MSRVLLASLVGGLGLGACEDLVYVPQQDPPLSCWHLDVVEAQGPDVQTASGVDVEAVVEALEGATLEAADAVGSRGVVVSIGEVTPADSAELVQRRLPPSAQVESGVDGIDCLEGELVTTSARVELALQLDDVGTLLLPFSGTVEARSPDDDGVGLRFSSSWTPLGELELEWRDAVQHAVPEGSRRKRLRLRAVGAGTLAEGAVHVFVTELDRYGRPTDVELALDVRWPR